MIINNSTNINNKKVTITYHLNSGNTKPPTTTYDVGNSGTGLWHVQQFDIKTLVCHLDYRDIPISSWMVMTWLLHFKGRHGYVPSIIEACYVCSMGEICFALQIIVTMLRHPDGGNVVLSSRSCMHCCVISLVLFCIKITLGLPNEHSTFGSLYTSQPCLKEHLYITNHCL